MRFVLSISLVLLLSACEQAEQAAPPPYQTKEGDVEFLMHMVLEPAADVIWDSAGFVLTAEGEEDLSPTTDEGWMKVQHSAAVLAESGNLMLLPGRSQPGDWNEISNGLTRISLKAMAAAEAKDAEQLFEVGGQIYNVCVSCHQLYWLDRES
ncbi:MAG: hypothetical protein AAF512_12320 [Pseudomonadota bacterium]